MKIIKFLFVFIISSSVYSFEFKQGEGSQFIMQSQGQNIQLDIYVSEVNEKRMGVEFHFAAGGYFGAEMWQQFGMKFKAGKIDVSEGYVLVSGKSEPEIMKDYMFKQNKGVQLNDFIFSSQDQIDGSFVGDEKVEIPAGSIVAKHYRKENNGQVVDFWIADEVKPIGLVKLVSKSDRKKFNNYTIELNTLIKGVAPKIDPKNAVPMSKKTEEMLKEDPGR